MTANIKKEVFQEKVLRDKSESLKDEIKKKYICTKQLNTTEVHGIQKKLSKKRRINAKICLNSSKIFALQRPAGSLTFINHSHEIQ